MATHLLDGLLTLEIFQTPNPTPDYTDASPTRIKPKALRTLRSSEISPPPPLGIVQSTVAAAATTSNPKTRHIADLVQPVF